jgi:GT2 family glycosyltransferase
MIESINAVFLSHTGTTDTFELTQVAANSLLESMRPYKLAVHITIVESNSAAAGDGFVYPVSFQVITPGETFNFNRFLNIGVAARKADYYLLCNNDIVFSRNWFGAFKDFFDAHPLIGSFSPRCPLTSNQKLLPNKNDADFVIGYRPTYQLSGWCILLRRGTWEQIGPLDENFDFYFADDDYSLMLRCRNILHALVFDSTVAHLEHRKVSRDTTRIPAQHTTGRLPWELRLGLFSWIRRNPKMLSGYMVFRRKWGNRLFYTARRILHDILVLKLKLRFMSPVILGRWKR